jgi:hypothetical protein
MTITESRFPAQVVATNGMGMAMAIWKDTRKVKQCIEYCRVSIRSSLATMIGEQ